MDTTVPDGPNAQFQKPGVASTAFSDELAAEIAANAADVALLIDEAGIVRDAAFPGEDFGNDDVNGWIGKAWLDLVKSDSQEKVTDLIEAAGQEGQRRWRQVNHIQSNQPDLPIRYFTLPTKREGWVLAIGRDMRAAARMQQRMIQAQRSMENDYAKAREAETRFRLLFQMASEGVIIIDGDTYKVTDANPAAAHILGQDPEKLEGRSMDSAFGMDQSETVHDALAVARKTGQAEQIELSPKGKSDTYIIRTSVFRQSSRVFFLVRIIAKQDQSTSEANTYLSQLAEVLPDGLMLTSEDGRILSVNNAFAELAQLNDAESILGKAAVRYLGRTETELNVLMANLREHGVVRNFATTLRSQFDQRESVEVSAVAAPGPKGMVFAFSIRPIGRRLEAGYKSDSEALPSNVDRLSELVGRLALKDIVRESTDMIERGCIEAALELTNNNRASAAELLGLSRQSLYAKMHRHNIGELRPKSGR